MLAGDMYAPADPDLQARGNRAKRLLRVYNEIPWEETMRRHEVLNDLLGSLGETCHIVAPFYCDYGENTYIGENFFANTGCVFLDCADIRIGRDVMFAPYVQLYAATHPVDPIARCSGRELASPITIGDRAWLGGGVIVLPGVTIGENTTIGAGSVVTKDIPANVVAAGNPCRVIREI